jgi:enoyl-CoA hydratase/carnithine racemase
VVLTGTPPAFCAGADLSAGGGTFDPPPEGTFSAAAVEMRAWDVRKPVIAAVNGHAIGIWFTMALQCGIRYFAAEAAYGIVQIRRGVMEDANSHWILPRLAGMAAAADILLTCRTFDGHQAQVLGVCNRVLPNDEVLAAALETAHEIAANTAPLSVAFSKRLLWESWGRTPVEIEQLETDAHHHLVGRPDTREGDDGLSGTPPAGVAGERLGRVAPGWPAGS